jgi:hypothetical protein
MSTPKPNVSESEISDKEAAMTSRDFVAGQENLWVPEHGWDLGDPNSPTDETVAAVNPFRPQYLAAMQIFLHFFGPAQRVWVHLAADMQAGKTGVLSALIRLMLNGHNYRKVAISRRTIFVCTGMSDNDWRKQTRKRLPNDLRANVYHNKGLTKLAAELRRKAAAAGLRNVLVAIDESHLAMSTANRPAQLIFDTLRDLCPVEQWAERNIRLLTISATDPASVLAAGAMREVAEVVPLRTDDGYQSIAMMRDEGRIKETFDLDRRESVKRLTDFIAAQYGQAASLYHILRPRPSKAELVESELRSLVPGCNIIRWDAKSNAAANAAAAAAAGAKRSDTSSTASDDDKEDINTTLEKEPEAPTFIIIKNMFYAAKTLEDRYVGVLHDRTASKDDTNLQSLLGRACGYGKSKRTIVFTTMSTVENYLRVWSQLTSRSGARVVGMARDLDRKMPGVGAATVEGSVGGRKTDLHITGARALPFRPSEEGGGAAGGSSSSASSNPFEVPAPPVRASNEASETGLKEFPSMVMLNKWWAKFHKERTGEAPKRDLRTPNQADDVYICSIGGKSGRQDAEAIRRFCVGTKGWGSAITEAGAGDLVSRVYAGYENERPFFFLRWAIKA